MRTHAQRGPSKTALGLALALGMVVATLVVAKAPIAHAGCNGDPSCGMTFAQTATTSNTSGDLMILDNPNINNQPGWELFVTQAWPGSYDPHPIEAWYSSWDGRWIIMNQDQQPIPLGTTFDVNFMWPGLAHLTDYQITQVTASASNVTSNGVTIDSPVTNGDPSAVVYATQVGNGVYDPHDIGVFYNNSAGKWAVFNEDGSAMPLGATFSVALNHAWNDGAYISFLQTASASNTHNGYITYFNDPSFNGQPTLQPQVTQVYDQGGTCGCILNNHVVGVWYDASAGEWTIYNVDRAAMPVGAAFYITGPF